MSVGYNDSQLKNKTGITPTRGGFIGKCARSNSQGTRFHLSTEREIYHDYSGTKERKQPDQKITGKVVDGKQRSLDRVNIEVEGTAASYHRHRRNFLIKKPSTENTDIYLYRFILQEALKSPTRIITAFN